MRTSFPLLNFLLVILLARHSAFTYAQVEVASSPVNQAAPAELYAALPGARGASLSPDGKLLALIAPVKGRNALVVWDLAGKDKTRVIPTGEFEPDWISWKSNHRLIASVRFFSMRDPFTPTMDTRLIAFDSDGGHALELVNSNLFKTYIPQIQDKVVSLLPSDENQILVELPAIERNGSAQSVTADSAQYGSMGSRIKYPEVVRLDINSGKITTVAHQHGRVIGWQADANGEPRIGQSINRNIQDYQILSKTDGLWHTVQSFEVNSGRIFSPIAFVDGNPDHLYALSNHEGKSVALYELDVLKDTFVRTIASSPTQSVVPILKDGRLLGYRIGYAKPIYLDTNYAKEANLIDRALPGSVNNIIDRTTDGKRVLVFAKKGNEPPTYWLLDRNNEKPEFTPIAETYPDLNGPQIASTRAVTYKARDGLEIPALLTLPPGYIRGATPLAFVVLPHGGPTSHDAIGFDYWVQFIASRGYGVLQPQFRGSTGYGASFELAGHQQWGLLMQDDVTDGTRWLIDQKLADPARIAIVGASYGGYAALMGAVKEPKLYRCAVAVAPVTDLELLIERLNSFYFGDLNIPRIGSDSAVLKQTSPVRNADLIQIPILLIHGRKDYTVPVAHTERMEDALKKAGKLSEVIYLKDGDHFLSHADDRLTTLKGIEKFLSSNLKQ